MPVETVALSDVIRGLDLWVKISPVISAVIMGFNLFFFMFRWGFFSSVARQSLLTLVYCFLYFSDDNVVDALTHVIASGQVLPSKQGKHAQTTAVWNYRSITVH